MLLFGWMLGILLPFYSFRRFSPEYQVAFDAVFHTHASHVLMHTFLYAVLACLIAGVLPQVLRRSRRVLFPVVLLGIALLAGLQEAIQMASEQVPLGADEIFDFCVDMNGGLLGVALSSLTASRQSKKKT